MVVLGDLPDVQIAMKYVRSPIWLGQTYQATLSSRHSDTIRHLGIVLGRGPLVAGRNFLPPISLTVLTSTAKIIVISPQVHFTNTLSEILGEHPAGCLSEKSEKYLEQVTFSKSAKCFQFTCASDFSSTCSGDIADVMCKQNYTWQLVSTLMRVKRIQGQPGYLVL